MQKRRHCWRYGLANADIEISVLLKKWFVVGSIKQSSLRKRQNKSWIFVSGNSKDYVKENLMVRC